MRLLVDTNIFLEVILEQERAAEARELLARGDQHEFFITDFSLHSIGIFLFHCKRHDVFQQFVDDMLLNVGITVVALLPREMGAAISAAQAFHLDFDDAYQYALAEKHNLEIVSFDTDFRTEKGRRTPDVLIS